MLARSGVIMKKVSTINRPSSRSAMINWIILTICMAVLFSLVLDLKGIIDLGWSYILGI